MILISDVGSPEANSYISIEEGDVYFSNRPNSLLWFNLEEETKGQLLIQGTRSLDYTYQFLGTPTYPAQARKFPRTGITLTDGTEVPSVIIPIPIKEAAMEVGFLFLDNDRYSDSATAGIDTIKAGSLMLKASAGGMDSTYAKVIPDFIEAMIREFITSDSAFVVNLIRR